MRRSGERTPAPRPMLPMAVWFSCSHHSLLWCRAFGSSDLEGSSRRIRRSRSAHADAADLELDAGPGGQHGPIDLGVIVDVSLRPRVAIQTPPAWTVPLSLTASTAPFSFRVVSMSPLACELRIWIPPTSALTLSPAASIAVDLGVALQVAVYPAAGQYLRWAAVAVASKVTATIRVLSKFLIRTPLSFRFLVCRRPLTPFMEKYPGPS